MSKKLFVLDTNILMDDPLAMNGFEDNFVLIPATVLQELDKHKTDSGETGYNVRRSIRMIEELAAKSPMDVNEFPLENGGFLILYQGAPRYTLSSVYSEDVADNRILNDVMYLDTTASSWEKTDASREISSVILVTNDVSMRLNARTLGVTAQPYKNAQVNPDKRYTGRGELVTSVEIIFELKRQLKNADNADYGEFGVDIELPEDMTVHENQYFVLRTADDEEHTVCQFRGGKFYPINILLNPMGIKQRNVGQGFALHALMSSVSELPLVILDGRAGTAKTFLSLACGIDRVYGAIEKKHYKNNTGDNFSKLVYTRPNQLSDRDHGYLKGDLFEKMMPLLGPAFDNLEQLIAGETGEEPDEVRTHVEDLFVSGQIEALSMAYMRGRSISNAYIVVDEAQNCTRSQIYDIISRAGMNTKVVLCGDSNQIDNPLLDKRNNGLVFAMERLKDSPMCAQVTFDGEGECVRSALAAEATKRLS